MGEVYDQLVQTRDRLLAKKQQIQNFNMTELNQKINKINFIIQKIEENGWDI